VVESSHQRGVLPWEGGAAVTPPGSPSTELRNLMQQILLVEDLYTRNGLSAVSLAIIGTWVARLRNILAMLEA
jgi:hypothetical protein